jgi:hypothetical protein
MVLRLMVFLVGLVAAPQRGAVAHLELFITSDCPIANYYAPTIQQLCRDGGRKGLSCTLVYEDLEFDDGRLRAHLSEYGYRDIAATIDRDRSIARRAGATITPQAVLWDSQGKVRYRGRIDNRYESLGKPRRVITDRTLENAVHAVLAGRAVASPEAPALGCHIVFPSRGSTRP